ncbi:hypothetical protein FB451DRAFT_1362984 [Mycena latifolia]|nr:hypothetical protein FB451DRAFT_1362984 [Mycena latifolia]
MAAVDFNFNKDRMTVQCKVCSSTVPVELRTWITAKNAARRLQSRPHLQAVDQIEEARRVRERLQKERETDSANAKLQETQFQVFSKWMSDAEAKMWADYRLNGAEFTANDDNESPDEQLKRLRQAAVSFGMWSPGVTARKLGFGPEDDEMGPLITAEEEEDDFLANAMRLFHSTWEKGWREAGHEPDNVSWKPPDSQLSSGCATAVRCVTVSAQPAGCFDKARWSFNNRKRIDLIVDNEYNDVYGPEQTTSTVFNRVYGRFGACKPFRTQWEQTQQTV